MPIPPFFLRKFTFSGAKISLFIRNARMRGKKSPSPEKAREGRKPCPLHRLGMLMPVISRTMYMLTCRALEILAFRVKPRNTSGLVL